MAGASVPVWWLLSLRTAPPSPPLLPRVVLGAWSWGSWTVGCGQMTMFGKGSCFSARTQGPPQTPQTPHTEQCLQPNQAPNEVVEVNVELVVCKPGDDDLVEFTRQFEPCRRASDKLLRAGHLHCPWRPLSRLCPSKTGFASQSQCLLCRLSPARALCCAQLSRLSCVSLPWLFSSESPLSHFILGGSG